ncbi:MAG: hypothetical protein JRK53_03030 [Deltaproteobacteria bacterium]|nr:hypothetical protein [Deltaproteobacteria bacterium]
MKTKLARARQPEPKSGDPDHLPVPNLQGESEGLQWEYWLNAPFAGKSNPLKTGNVNVGKTW